MFNWAIFREKILQKAQLDVDIKQKLLNMHNALNCMALPVILVIQEVGTNILSNVFYYIWQSLDLRLFIQIQIPYIIVQTHFQYMVKTQ